MTTRTKCSGDHITECPECGTTLLDPSNHDDAEVLRLTAENAALRARVEGAEQGAKSARMLVAAILRTLGGSVYVPASAFVELHPDDSIESSLLIPPGSTFTLRRVSAPSRPPASESEGEGSTR